MVCFGIITKSFTVIMNIFISKNTIDILLSMTWVNGQLVKYYIEDVVINTIDVSLIPVENKIGFKMQQA